MHIFEFFILIRTAGESQIMKIITVFPQWDLNPCGKLHGNPSNSCWDTLLRIDCLSGRSSVNHNCLYQICPVELYHKISKTWGHQRQYNSSSEDHECQSNIVILRAVSMAEKKKTTSSDGQKWRRLPNPSDAFSGVPRFPNIASNVKKQFQSKMENWIWTWHKESSWLKWYTEHY